MDRLTKMLIFVVIILTAGLSLTVGVLLGNNFNKTTFITNNTTNQGVLGNNSSTTSTSQNSSNNPSKEITRDEAINIALANVGPINQAYYVQTDYSVGTPHKWHVDFYNKKTSQHIVGVSIDAGTGEVRAIYK